ncbi:MAG: hypothetical protein WCT50_01440 [Patescibacteria group bacterium]|jgi:hypothetical protein
MENNNLGDKILETIKEHRIKPKGRWYFLLKNYLIWLAGALALLAAGASLSVMIYFFQYNDFGMRREINKSLAEMLILTMPYLWLIFLGIFVFIIYYNLKHTKTGYRYQIWFIMMSAVLASIFLGGLFSLAGWGEKLDEVLEEKTPFYGQVMNPHLDFWSNPEEGRLVGVVDSFSEDGNLNLVDKDRTKWTINISEEDMKMPIIMGQPIRILGEKESKSTFKAKKILPMMPGRGFFKHVGPRAGMKSGREINNNMVPPPRMNDSRMKKDF